MKQLTLGLQFFADIAGIMSEHSEALAGHEGFDQNFSSVSETLSGLGYDVLINKKDSAEYIPVERLNATVAQRETFKQQAEAANAQLEALKTKGSLTEAEKAQLDTLISKNEGLLADLKNANIALSVATSAKDAINPQDIITFINVDQLTIDEDGKITKGLDKEIERLKREMDGRGFIRYPASTSNQSTQPQEDSDG